MFGKSLFSVFYINFIFFQKKNSFADAAYIEKSQFDFSKGYIHTYIEHEYLIFSRFILSFQFRVTFEMMVGSKRIIPRKENKNINQIGNFFLISKKILLHRKEINNLDKNRIFRFFVFRKKPFYYKFLIVSRKEYQETCY